MLYRAPSAGIVIIFDFLSFRCSYGFHFFFLSYFLFLISYLFLCFSLLDMKRIFSTLHSILRFAMK